MLNNDLIELLKQNNSARMFFVDRNAKHEIHSVFSLYEDDEEYFELYSDLVNANVKISTNDILDEIEKRPLDSRVDIVVGDEDGNDTVSKELLISSIVFEEIKIAS